MNWVRRLLFAFAAAAAVLASGAALASAQTFYVSHKGSGATCTARGIHACKGIDEAVHLAEKSAGANTIEVEGEGNGEGAVFKESVELDSAADSGLTIVGGEAHVEVVGVTTPPFTVGSAAGAVTISELLITNQTGVHAAVRDQGANLTLAGDTVENTSPSGVDGVEASGGGSVTIDGGRISMEGGAGGFGVEGETTPISLDGVTIETAAEGPDEAGGVASRRSGLSIVNTRIDVGYDLAEEAAGVTAEEDGAVTLTNVTVRQDSTKAGAVLLASSPATVAGLSVDMENPTSKSFGVGTTSSVPSTPSTFGHVEVSGAWTGDALVAQDGEVTIADSHLTASSGGASSAVVYVGESSSSLLVRRSVLQAPSATTTAALFSIGGTVTLDSAEVLGGTDAIRSENLPGAATSLTVDASTVDAGPPGVAADAFGVKSIDAIGRGTKAPGAVSVSVQGSILLEQQEATVEAGDGASVTCTYSDVPGQVQTAKGTEGSIGCAAGSAGNTEVASELPSLFSEPFTTYELSPSSAAIDSVPSSAITLPAGVTPSATDLAGDPRTVQIGTNGVCAPYQDRGALQLKGQASACTPAPVHPGGVPVATPVAGVLSALALSPSSFYAAPSGATSSRRRYGTLIAYRDSQVATTTFTVLRETTGRMRGRSCRRRNSSNAHARRCTILTAAGSFTHADIAGPDRLRFSGRIRGRRLAPGAYRLQAVPRDRAGYGAAVSAHFRIL